MRGVFSDAVRRGICSVVDGISGGRAEVTDSGRAGSNGRASWRAGLPVVLLLAVACAQGMLARTAGLSPWKGGGFGMFSTTDDAGRRHVRVFVSAHERSEEIAISPSLEDAAVRAAVLPSDGALSRSGASRRRSRAPESTPGGSGPHRGVAISSTRPKHWRQPHVSCASSFTVWTRLRHPATDEDGVADPVLKLTAIILLLRPLDVWWVAPFVLAAACLSLVLRAVRRAPVTWCFCRLVAVRIVVWPLSDNHIYLLAYWCLAIGLALSARARGHAGDEQSMAPGAAFAMAVLWKAVLSPDYVDGRFFRVTLLTDERFADASLVFGGLSRDQMAENRKFLEPLPEGAELLNPPAFVEPPRLRVFAAIAHLGRACARSAGRAALSDPGRGTNRKSRRHAALLMFCATTYALAPVAGFGWLIATMGLAQCRPDQQLLRGAYIAAFVLILLYSEIPWTGVLAEWTAR